MRKWNFRDAAEPQGSSDGFWYDITSGGYIVFDELLADATQVKEANEAVALLMSLEQEMDDAGLLNEF